MTLARLIQQRLAPVACLVMGHRWGPWRTVAFLLGRRQCTRCRQMETIDLQPEHPNCRCVTVPTSVILPEGSTILPPTNPARWQVMPPDLLPGFDLGPERAAYGVYRIEPPVNSDQTKEKS